ncbi:MAG TPA: hypothetical protein VFP59_13095 [Candidatus Angelobacter sp.]|nr:hypothetical protein [Candidatus Angelobacter sp.]
MKTLHFVIAGLLAFTGLAVAQQSSAPTQRGPAVMMGGPAHGMFLFSGRMDHKVVKGAPFSATETTEFTQVLADGNRIVHKQNCSVARDSEGRTRREGAMSGMGPLQVNGSKMIFIHDPVANAAYMLNPQKQTARVMKFDGMAGMDMTQMRERMQKMQKAMTSKEEGQIKTESLGTQEIEGIAADGKRVTRTIPAGAIGNEQPIQITLETWTSPDLQTVVLQKRNDPRFGETVFQLTNIKQGEPDASLFQVPSGYKKVEGSMRMMMKTQSPEQ